MAQSRHRGFYRHLVLTLRMPDVDVVIVNYRSATYTAACVDAARTVANADGIDINIVVVNNGDAQEELETLVAARGQATILHNPDNLGFGAACNIGASRGHARLILFLNPDALLKPGYFKATVAFMDGDTAGVGIIGPAIENESGVVTRTCAPLPGMTALIARTLGLTQGFLPARDHAASGRVGQVMGAALMIRRPLFEDLGGFDTRYFLYYEDVDLSARAASQGFASYYFTEARAVHVGRVSSSQDGGMALALFLRSRFTYARLHFGVMAQAVLVTLSFIAELPLRLLGTFVRRQSITGRAVLRAYRLLGMSLTSGIPIVALARRREST